jgi:hypothetical protein
MPNEPPPTDPLTLPPEAVRALAGGDKIEAIKLVRAAHKVDLKTPRVLWTRMWSCTRTSRRRSRAVAIIRVTAGSSGWSWPALVAWLIVRWT